MKHKYQVSVFISLAGNPEFVAHLKTKKEANKLREVLLTTKLYSTVQIDKIKN